MRGAVLRVSHAVATIMTGAAYDADALLLDARAGDDAALLVHEAPAVPVHDTVAWRAAHAFSFLLGGLTFILGTLALYSSAAPAALVSAALYTIGSCGFLAVDVQELFTFTREPLDLRLNIAASALGSACYVTGSVLFAPALLAAAPAAGAAGFDAGSAIIAASQAAKVARLLRARAPPSAVAVEAGAGVGAACFLGGTLVINSAPPATVLAVWLAGSASFTAGGVALAYRHFWLRVT